MNEVLKRYADVRVQAMMFDMDVDVETMQLVEKKPDDTPVWLRIWKDKVANGDNQPEFNVDQE